MEISKTQFMNMIRCPQYAGLLEVHKDKLDADVNIDKQEDLMELLGAMFDGELGEGEDQIFALEEMMEAMMPYYQEVENQLMKAIDKKYGHEGEIVFAKDLASQKKVNYDLNNTGIELATYLDGFQELEDKVRIFEVKATTAGKWLKLGSSKEVVTPSGFKGKVYSSIFTENFEGNLVLREQEHENLEEHLDGLFPAIKPKSYYNHKAKLFDRFKAEGKYFYDVAFQAAIIENLFPGKQIEYFLVVLNSDYVFDGTYLEDGSPDYKADIATIFDVTQLMPEYVEKIKTDYGIICDRLKTMDVNPVINNNCQYNQETSKCPMCKVCWKDVTVKAKDYNEMSIFQFRGDIGFTFGHKIQLYNQGIKNIKDIDLDAYVDLGGKSVTLNEKFTKIRGVQYGCAKTGATYANKKLIGKFIEKLEYPIYHLDFETFPCPLPRFKGESPYQQSLFQYSIHIEREPGVCDKEKDWKDFLAKNSSDDIREEFIIQMIEDLGTSGTILVYNVAFEKTRIKELAMMFPKYEKELKAISARLVDLMYCISGNKEFFELDESQLVYYHPKQLGSFSIKYVLPVFSDLTYEGMEVGNGMQAYLTYTKFDSLIKDSPEKYERKWKALQAYCKQDTWAMFEVLNGLREVI